MTLAVDRQRIQIGCCRFVDLFLIYRQAALDKIRSVQIAPLSGATLTTLSLRPNNSLAIRHSYRNSPTIILKQSGDISLLFDRERI